MSDTTASSPAAPSPSPAVLTLHDYIKHQRTLTQLLRSQPVWLLDDVLRLRYRARLRLSLSSHPQLLLYEDVVSDTPPGQDEHSTHERESTTAAARGHTSLVIPLAQTCAIEPLLAADAAGEEDDVAGGALRVRMAAAVADDVAPTSLLITRPSAPEDAAWPSAWATVLRRLCRQPPAPAVTRHADPVAPVDNGSTSVAALPHAHRSSSGGGGGGGGAVLTSPSRTAAVVDVDLDEGTRRLEQLADAWRTRAREAAALQAVRRHSSTPKPPSEPVWCDGNGGNGGGGVAVMYTAAAATAAVAATAAAVAAVAEVEGELEVPRPPTMAHAGAGLSPALGGIPSLLPDVDESEGEDARSGVSGGSARPQAPRGGHVGDLGSLGPTHGDAEALRMYKDIHGDHSTTVTTHDSSSSSSLSASSSLHDVTRVGDAGDAAEG
ncbi:hypothetical protein NESM_000278600 [Novymonas esmeraldas]|uniref:Uncharacterized protein n=1 Tax=Novymonas esmeraldas TaxID=1808958 RepID=A0AAW0FDL5_9TRYP